MVEKVTEPNGNAIMIFVAAFIVVNLVVPFTIGELYPFSTSPMFCDQPTKYCTYEVVDADGDQVDLKRLGLHLVYDGNPPGLGVGIVPSPTLHAFGEVPERTELVPLILEKLSSELDLKAPLTVTREVVQAGNHKLESHREVWTIEREVSGQ